MYLLVCIPLLCASYSYVKNIYTSTSTYVQIKLGKSVHQVPIHPSYSYDGLTITTSTTTSADESTPHSSSQNTLTAGTTLTVDTEGKEYVIKEPGYMYFDDFQDITKGLGRVKSATGNSEVQSSSADKERIGTVAVMDRLAETAIMKLPYHTFNHSSTDNTDKGIRSGGGDEGERSYRLDDLIPLLFPITTQPATASTSTTTTTTAPAIQTLEQYAPLSEAQWDLIADLFGETSHVRTSVDWFRRILTDLNLIDTYSDTYPNQLMRYTCYDQQTNRRYVNLGSRIDHILVSRDWWLSSSPSASLPSGASTSLLSLPTASSASLVERVDKTKCSNERVGRYMLQGYELFTSSGDGRDVLESFCHQGLYSNTPVNHTNNIVDIAHSHIPPPLPPFLPFKSLLAQQHINTLLDKNRPSSTGTGATDLSLPNQSNLTYEVAEGRAALLATTGYNLFQPASFEGGGIPNSTEVCSIYTCDLAILYLIYTILSIILYPTEFVLISLYITCMHYRQHINCSSLFLTLALYTLRPNIQTISLFRPSYLLYHPHHHHNPY